MNASGEPPKFPKHVGRSTTFRNQPLVSGDVLGGRRFLRYVVTETAVNTLPSVAFSVLFAYLFFRGSPMVDMGSRAVLFDSLPQSFAVAFMTFLIPTLLTRVRLRSGKIGRLNGTHIFPQNVLARSVLVGAVAAIVCTIAYAALMPTPGVFVLSFGEFLALKGVLGAILSAVLAPFALSAALKDAN